MREWVERVIVKYNICPFARKELEAGTVRYVVAHSDKLEPVLTQLMQECEYLEHHSDTETTLFMLPNGFERFDDFLELSELANSLLAAQGYEGIFQLASFHPHYCFAGELESDAANYTNRSPYAALHILREQSVERAIEEHNDVDAIPERNIEFARRKGADFFAKLLVDIKKSSTD